MQPTQEQWLPVVGYEGLYEVSDQGRVRSLDRTVVNTLGRQYRLKGRLLKLQPGDGRPVVALSRDGFEKTTRVLHIVARAFIGECPAGMEVCHNNGNANDNRATNLRYDTRSANILDNVKFGVHWQTRKTHCALGHPYDITLRGRRRCSICVAIWNQRTLARRKAKRASRKVAAA